MNNEPNGRRMSSGSRPEGNVEVDGQESRRKGKKE
jgi:hypothetical protein